MDLIGTAQLLPTAAAIAAGLLIGIERGWKLRREPEGTRVAGVRTFTLLGFVGGLAAVVGREGHWLASGAIMSAAAAMLTAGYVRSAVADNSVDATSAIAALATLALGFVAGNGSPALAMAGASMVTLILALRSEAHRFVERLDQEDVKALARYAVIAGAILPFLPDGDYGPLGAWNPRKLWLVVVLVTGFSFAGYVANRIFGTRHGTVATALIGGAYSSTAVTQSLAQRARGIEDASAECAGIALASAVMYLRVVILVAAIATSVFLPFAAIVAPALTVASVAGIWLYSRASAGHGAQAPGNPIALVPALGFLLFVALAAIAARWAEGQFGQQGLAFLILIMGSVDVDAAIVTVGGLKAGAISPAMAALALGGTVLANMGVKLAITIGLARSNGRAAALALSASMVALTIGLGIALLRQ